MTFEQDNFEDSLQQKQAFVRKLEATVKSSSAEVMKVLLPLAD